MTLTETARPAAAEPDAPRRHAGSTRLLHGALALAVVTQLVTCLVLVPAETGHAGNLWFEIHEFSGLVAFATLLAFWIAMSLRRRGTPPGLLFPWLSADRLCALGRDAADHLRAARRLRFPAEPDRSPLAAAIHGLGLLLITAMAVSGTVYYVVNSGDPDAGGLVGAVMLVHRSLANLVWAYLVGHAGMAVLAHVSGHLRLGQMWLPRPDRARP